MQGPVGAGGSWKCKGVQRKRQRKNRRCPTIGEGIEKGRTRVTPCNEGWPLGPGQMLPLINPVDGAEPLDHAGGPSRPSSTDSGLAADTGSGRLT
jgi:hypothetical protein